MGAHLRGGALVGARAVWILLVVSALGLFIASVPAHLRELLIVTDAPRMWLQVSPVQAQILFDLGLSVRAYAMYLLVLQGVVVAGFFGLSLLIFWRRSDDGMAIFVSLVSVLYGMTSVPLGQALAGASLGWHLPVDALNALGWGGGLLLFYVFPDGRFVPRWTQWLAVAVTTWVLMWPFLPTLNPDQWAFPLPFITKVGWYSTGIFAQVYRYVQRSTPVQRQQTKWAVLGFAAAFAGFVAFNLPVVCWAELRESGAARLLYLLLAYPILALLPTLLAPVALGFACLRYRLWDVDLVLNRTLIYGVLTTALVLAYAGCVVVLQWLFRRLTGQDQSDLVTAISTLAIAAMFQPVRRRVQRWIDRSFFRRKYEAQEALNAFGAVLRNNVQADLNRLTGDLLDVIDRTMQPAYISVWLPHEVRAGKIDAFQVTQEHDRE